MEWVKIKDGAVSVIVLLLVAYLFWNFIKSKPSDKYHNDSWKKKN